MKRTAKTTAAVLAFLVCGMACSKKPEGTRYTLTGTIVARYDAGNFVIAHEQIPNLMPAMMMPYKVVDAPADAHPGDAIKATLIVDKDTEWLEDLAVTKKAAKDFARLSAVPPAAELGSEVPDFLLRDQDGEPIHLGQFKGSVLMLTFIYTRCPFPDFCPLMMKDFNEVKHDIDSNPGLSPEAARKVHFLSVSLDPDYDTPAVLRAYGQRFIPGDDPFERWTLATAEPSQIRYLANWFGVSYSNDGQLITHSLSTAIIGADGKLITLMEDNAWRPEDAAAIVARATLGGRN